MATSAVEAKRGQQPVLTRHVGQLAIWITVTALLFGFVVVVAREVAATLDGDVASVTDDEYVLFATSLTGLVGGVFAAAIGAVPRATGRRAPGPTDESTGEHTDPWRTRLAAAYVVAYAIAGIVATVVCITRLGSATPLLQSLAGAFMGASAAAASAFFGVAAEPRADAG
jgi:hypothetical protein